eukprot:TRINITY_DN8407_c0_g1_i1.p1 TRINITY_DN8407_c0_g1~~TRINITY_DN8407_c0_g1_i1.p1  ORF type:complete len:282 (-),score=76.69 TRINITY_DN8407_c0_g1_i1:64-909(-)
MDIKYEKLEGNEKIKDDFQNSNLSFDIQESSEGEGIMKNTEENKGDYLKSFIYGGMDGIISVFVAIGVASLTNLSNPKIILVLAIAKLVAGSFSMGVGDWLAGSSFIQFARGERKREKWECDNFYEGEIKEMTELFEKKGMSSEDARQFVTDMSSNQRAMIDFMMIHELGISPDEEKQTPWKNGLVNFGSFLMFGTFPIVPFLIYFIIWTTNNKFRNDILFNSVSSAIFVVTLMVLGFIKANLSKTNRLASMIEAVVAGCIAGVAGAAIGWGLVKLLNINI